MRPTVTVIDYGMGNLWSVVSALSYLGCGASVTGDPHDVAGAETLLLPGVGSFRRAMLALRSTGLDQAIIEAVQGKERKILGICLGMQLMSNRGSEDGETPGLSLISTSTDAFSSSEVGASKIPHIGFDLVRSQPDARLTRGLPSESDFYFVHSYRMLPGDLSGALYTCSYGIDFLAAYDRDNIFATQFHPEKSQTNGLVLLRNFLAQ